MTTETILPTEPDPRPSWLGYFGDDDDDLDQVDGGGQSSAVWSLHSEQLKVWQSQARIRVVCSGRRGGKSDVGVRWLLAGAMDDAQRDLPGISWVVMPTYSMARPLWRKFLAFAPPGWITKTIGTETLPDTIQVGPARIEFKSGDHPERIVGEGLRRALLDEAGILKERVYFESILPALMDFCAPAMMTGTPKGHNWFHRMFERGLDPLDTEVESFSWPTSANPFLKDSFGEVEHARREMPARLFRQEILAEFLGGDGAVFRDHRGLAGPASAQRTVCYGLDLARKADYTVVFGFDESMRWTFYDRWGRVDWPQQIERIRAINDHARNGGVRPLWVVDATGAGDPIAQELQRSGLRVDPFVFSSQSKGELIDALIVAVEKGAQRIIGGIRSLPDDPVFMNELDVFDSKVGPTGRIRYAAPDQVDSHDDCVCALALAVRGVTGARDGVGISF